MIITREQFLKLRKAQILNQWMRGEMSDASLIDWLLVYGDDGDIEWLAEHFPNADQGMI